MGKRPFGMLMPGRSYSSGAYRYGFNGKENDNDVKGTGNSVDFGARVYDPRIGRFLSKDKMSNSSEAPYGFAGNSPIALTDFNGYFKISPFFVKKYPTLARMLEVVLPSLIGETDLMNHWIGNLGFNNYEEGKAAWKEMLTFGSGPWLTPNRPMSELNDAMNQALGAFFGEAGDCEYEPRYPNNITLGYVNLDKLETVLKNGNGQEISYQMFIVMVQTIHEGSHWARRQKVKKQPRTNFCFEDGAMGEEAILGGTRFSYSNCNVASASANGFDYDKAKNYYNNFAKQFTAPGTDMKKGLAIPQVPLCISISALKVNIPQGHPGDKTLSDNGDKEPKVFLQKERQKSVSQSNSFSYDY